MPHSSGGGSYSGGSHGGSHGGHSGSYHSSSYSSRSHSYGRPYRRRRRYVYYRHNTPKYFYADTDHKPGFSISKILVCIILMGIGAFLLFKAIPRIPHYSNHKIVIKDEVNVIEDEERVMSELKAFQDKTGITPSVITITNEEWMYGHTSLEDYAYDRYLAEFSDEMHWLIVYSQPAVKQSKRMYWYWEGMQGDKTDSVLTAAEEKGFRTAFHSYLSNNESFDDALVKSFSSLTENISMSPDPLELIIPVLVLALAVILTIITLYKAFKYRNAKPDGYEDSDYTGSPQVSTDTFPAFDPNKYSNTGSSNDTDIMPSLDSIPSKNGTSNSYQLVSCQYCGCSFTDKYDRCPFCSAKR